MAKVDVSKVITASQDTLWAKISNPTTFPDWLTIHDGWRGEVPTEVSEGSQFTEMCTVMGMTNKIDFCHAICS